MAEPAKLSAQEELEQQVWAERDIAPMRALRGLLKTRADAALAMLRVERDHNNMIHLQGQIQSYDSVLDVIENGPVRLAQQRRMQPQE